MGLQTSADSPAPVRQVSKLIGDWIGRLGFIWVEGQVAQFSRRSPKHTAFITLRDTVAQISLSVTCPPDVLNAVEGQLSDGSRIIVHARPSWYFTRGTLSLAADDIRLVGLGELLARIERLRKALAAEGLFASERKRPLPFLPRTVGLICGRDSKAEHDVRENATRRWPGVTFQVESVAVQGTSAVPHIMEALRALDRDPKVDVIVLARGGGSVEDLLPFSDEALVRAVAAAHTPIVSAIGHESDAPLVDLAADVRASTPTDAAKRIVPDVSEEHARLQHARERMRHYLTNWVRREHDKLSALLARPALANPTSVIDQRKLEVDQLQSRARRTFQHVLERATVEIDHTVARVQALSPAATLQRGYAIVQRGETDIIRSGDDVAVGDHLHVLLSHGSLDADVTAISSKDSHG